MESKDTASTVKEQEQEKSKLIGAINMLNTLKSDYFIRMLFG